MKKGKLVSVFKTMSFIYILGTIVILSSYTNVSSASKLRLSYNGKKSVYTGQQVKSVTVNNKKIKLNGTNGILLKGNAMVSYKDVFQKGLGVKCSYSKTKKKLVMKQNGVSIVMTLGSKTAYINGKKKKMPAAPVNVRYVKKKASKILVPSKFVAQNLGYTYTWNKKQGSIALIRPTLVKYNGTWHIYKKSMETLVVNGFGLDPSIPALSIGGSILIPAKQVFGSMPGIQYSYDSNAKQITLQSSANEVKMTIGSNVALINGAAQQMKTAPWVVKLKNTGKSYVMVPASFTASVLDCYYLREKSFQNVEIQTKTYFSWNGKNHDYDASKYANTINQCVGQYDLASKSVLVLVTAGNPEAMPNIVETKDAANNQVHFDFPATFNDIGDSFYENLSPLFKRVDLTQLNEETARLTLSMSDLESYEYAVQGNQLSIHVYRTKVGSYSIQFLKPNGVDYSAITNEDLYEKNTFTITLPGNHVDFFKSNPIKSNHDAIRSIQVGLSGANTVITVATSKLQGYRVYDQGRYVGVAVGNPRDIYKNIVVLDAGHGGKDSGATNNKVLEKDLNLKIIYEYAKKYFNAPGSPVKAYWTRKDDTFVELYDRAGYAQVMGADIFVSLHMNSYSSANPKGTEVYYSDSNNGIQPSGLNSKTMAGIYKNNIVNGLGMADRGVQSQKYVVVHRNTVPAVLIELGFISNSSDLKKITNPSVQDQAAKIIYDSTVEIFNKYPTGR